MVKIFHFHNGTGGGVLSVIRNLLSYNGNSDIENHVIYTINKEQVKSFEKPGLKGAVSEQVFYYSHQWNFYYTCKQLSQYLPNDKAVIVAHDWLELGMVSNLGLNNPLVFFVHGNYQYYYDLCLKHYKNVNLFITVNKAIKNNLNEILPHFVNVVHLKFPVPEINYSFNLTERLNCTYFVSLLTDSNKQFQLIPLIDAKLQLLGVNINWHIAGAGITNEELVSFWNGFDIDRIHFYGTLNSEGIEKMLTRCQIMILPSLKEGFPVSVVEAMKSGIIPLVNEWGKTLDELIINRENGFIIHGNIVESYAEIINNLHIDRRRLQIMSLFASSKANELFNPFINTQNIYSASLEFINNSHLRLPQKVYGSRLDNKHIPNFFTYLFRNLKLLFNVKKS